MRLQLRTVALCALLALPALATAAKPVIEVYKSATCGCCQAWADHLKENGFTVKVNNVADTATYRQKFGIPAELGSCHTAKVGGYAIEGHVPASDIKRLLAARAKARGLAVPEMPHGSPGMETGRTDPYDVLLIEPDGRTKVYQHYAGKPARSN